LGLRAATEEHLEELVDEFIVGRQGVIFQYKSGHKLQQAFFQPGAHALNTEATKTIRIRSRVLHSNDAAKRQTEYIPLLKAQPFHKFRQVLDKLVHSKSASESKTIFFTAQLVSDYAIIRRQSASERRYEINSPSQAWDYDEWRAISP